MDTKKKILFVINTLGRAGAEMALIELLRVIDKQRYEIDLMVLAEQGELIHEIPEGIHVCNAYIDDTPVLSREGTGRLIRRMVGKCIKKSVFFHRFMYLVGNTFDLMGKHIFSANKLTRRLLADSAPRLEKEYDLAVAYIEGGASFYVDEYVRAKSKAVFLHVDYNQAGYTRRLDADCYLHFDHIFTVSDEVSEAFWQTYPECREKTSVFHNLINTERIRKKARMTGGFSDEFEGFRILTVGRLYAQKAFEVSIEAMKLLKDAGYLMRWYVLGEGEERTSLEKQIEDLDLKEDFLLCGAVDNPYPYFAQCDLYVHASRYEGKSIAVQEAQVCGCPIIVSDCQGNREQVIPGVDGVLCRLTPESIRDEIVRLYEDEVLRNKLAKAAGQKHQVSEEELEKLYELL